MVPNPCAERFAVVDAAARDVAAKRGVVGRRPQLKPQLNLPRLTRDIGLGRPIGSGRIPGRAAERSAVASVSGSWRDSIHLSSSV